MMHNTRYISPLLFSFASATFAIYFLLWLSKKYNFSKTAKRLGGVAVIFVFVALVLLNKDLIMTRQIWGILLGVLMVFAFGLWDDLRNASWRWQLMFQISIAISAISFGVRSEHIINPLGGTINVNIPIIYFILYTLYFILLINSLNWLDGIDGLAGSVTLVALATLFFLSLLPHVNQPAVAILCVISGGAILGFLVFNWHPAKIFAGTSGAWFFGFLLASLSIFAGAKIATVLMAALIPILDFINVIVERFFAGQSVFCGGDNRHLHHKLLKLGLGERQIVILIVVLSALIGMIALNISAIGKIIFIFLFSAAYFGLIRAAGAKERIRSKL